MEELNFKKSKTSKESIDKQIKNNKKKAEVYDRNLRAELRRAHDAKPDLKSKRKPVSAEDIRQIDIIKSILG